MTDLIYACNGCGGTTCTTREEVQGQPILTEYHQHACHRFPRLVTAFKPVDEQRRF